MNNSDETLKKTPENEAVLQAIAELTKTATEISGKFEGLSNGFHNMEKRFDNLENKFDKLEVFVNVQFEAVRERIEYNSSRYDRLEAKFFDVRSDVSNMRADIRDLVQIVRKKELVRKKWIIKNLLIGKRKAERKFNFYVRLFSFN